MTVWYRAWVSASYKTLYHAWVSANQLLVALISCMSVCKLVAFKTTGSAISTGQTRSCKWAAHGQTRQWPVGTHCVGISVVYLTLDGVNGKWRWRRNLCQFDGENSRFRRQSSELSDGNTVIYDRYFRCHFWMTPYVHNTGWHCVSHSGIVSDTQIVYQTFSIQKFAPDIQHPEVCVRHSVIGSAVTLHHSQLSCTLLKPTYLNHCTILHQKSPLTLFKPSSKFNWALT